MYLILNKENDYKTSKSKIQALELSYKGIVKVISNQEGNLTESMLLNVKNNQDSTYTSLSVTHSELKTIFNSLNTPIVLPELEYIPLDTNKLKPYELGFENFVDNNLLTNIMQNETSFSSANKNILNNMGLAQTNVYNSIEKSKNKSSNKGNHFFYNYKGQELFNPYRLPIFNGGTSSPYYIPSNITFQENKNINKTLLNGIKNKEINELEATFYNLKFFNLTDAGNYQIVLSDMPSSAYSTDPNIEIYKQFKQNTTDGILYSIFFKTLKDGRSFYLGDLEWYNSNLKWGFDINNNYIKIYKKNGYYTYVQTYTFVPTPEKITANYIVNNF